MTTHQKTSVYNQVYPLQKPDYGREVTDASHNSFVLVNLTGNNVESRRLSELWRTLAAKFGDVKFCEIRGDLCIEGYPEKNTPTILVYRDGEIQSQFVTLMQLGGVRTRLEGWFFFLWLCGCGLLMMLADIERVLLDLGALKESDSRLKKKSDSDDDEPAGNDKEEDYDDDWD